MDWCDDVAFAVHDVVDFYRSGFIPLDRLFDLAAGDEEGPFALEAFFESLPESRNNRVAAMSRDRAWEVWREIQSYGEGFDIWRPTRKQKGAVHLITSGLITFFLDGVGWEGEAPCRYQGTLTIDPDEERRELKQDSCELLKELIWHFVIRTPGFATQQVGQARVVRGLMEACHSAHDAVLPDDRREELEAHGDILRACADHVASLTERQAEAAYRRLLGFDMGAITDAI